MSLGLGGSPEAAEVSGSWRAVVGDRGSATSQASSADVAVGGGEVLAICRRRRRYSG
ncbi:MAG: hypothetical protein AAB467_04480 [Patescibacteria group bacterium]